MRSSILLLFATFYAFAQTTPCFTFEEDEFSISADALINRFQMMKVQMVVELVMKEFHLLLLLSLTLGGILVQILLKWITWL